MFKIPVSAMIVLLPMATQAVTVSLGSTSAPLAEFTGEAVNDGAGVSVHSAGDVNNDGYDDVMVVLAKKSTGKIIHLRLTGEAKLKKLDHKQVATTDRRPITIRTYSSTHRFTTRIGNKDPMVSHKWQVTKQGALRLVE